MSRAVRDPDAIAVVILNWNNWQLSLKCIDSLKDSVGVTWHAYLVDNASNDGSMQHFSGLGDNVSVIASAVNGGWTGGNNLGIRRALDDGYDHIFVLNNDARVRPDTLRELLSLSRHHSTSPVIGPVHLSADESYIDFLGAWHDDKFGRPTNIGADTIDFDSYPDVYETAYIRGAGIFAQRLHFEKVGLFDDRFYLNYDETDWCYRVREQGYPLLMTKRAEILHVGSASIGGATSPLNIYFLTRNALLFSELHATLKQRVRLGIDLVAQLIDQQPGGRRRDRIVSLLRGKSTIAKAGRAGLRDYVLRRFGDCPPSVRAIATAT